MIVDTSALIAILRAQETAERCALAIEQATIRRLSAVSFVEAAAVIDGSGDPVASRRFEELVKAAALTIEPVTAEQAQTARAAYRDFGKGRHPAQLNLGDCFSYALAKAFDEPLLFVGDDFSKTDVKIA